MENFHEIWLPYKDHINIFLPPSAVMAWAWLDEKDDKQFDLFDERIILYTSSSDAKSYLKKFNNSLLTHSYGISGARSIYEKFIFTKYGKIELKDIPDSLYWNFIKISKEESPSKYKNRIVKQFKEKYKKYPLCNNTDRWNDSNL